MKTFIFSCLALAFLSGCFAPKAPDAKIVVEEVKPEKGRVVIDLSMEVRYYPVVPSFCERMMFACEDMKNVESEVVADETDDEGDWKLFFARFDVTWPEGSSIRYIPAIGKLRVRNTPENHALLADALREMRANPTLVEVSAWLFEVEQAALDEIGAELVPGKPAGYRYTVDDLADLPPAELQRRLSARRDNVLMAAPCALTRSGEETVVKAVVEYVYPTDYDVQLEPAASSSMPVCEKGLAAVEPQSFTMREVGTILDVTPTVTDDGSLIDLGINVQHCGRPDWNDYGAEPYAPNGGQYPLPMKQPFFPVLSSDTRLSCLPGETLLVSALPVQKKAEGTDRTRLVFLRARLRDLHGKVQKGE